MQLGARMSQSWLTFLGHSVLACKILNIAQFCFIQSLFTSAMKA